MRIEDIEKLTSEDITRIITETHEKNISRIKESMRRTTRRFIIFCVVASLLTIGIIILGQYIK